MSERFNLDNPWEMLCLAQHFDVPTRLLDWTSNPLVAAYFAVIDNSGVFKADDAVIWCFDVTQAVPKADFRDKMRGQRLSDLRTTTYFFEALDRRAALAGENGLSGFQIIQPPDIDNRIKNQAGLFSAHIPKSYDPRVGSYNHTTLDEFVWNHQEYLEQNTPNALHKIIVPAFAKPTVKAQLEMVGMNPNQVFPDLFGLGMYLRDWKTKRFLDDLLPVTPTAKAKRTASK